MPIFFTINFANLWENPNLCPIKNPRPYLTKWAMALRFVTPSLNNLAIDVELFNESSVGNHNGALYFNFLVKVFTYTLEYRFFKDF